MADERLRAWLRQARADWTAGQVDGVSPCHRRYWLQQACEKGIKALGLIMWRGHANEEGQFRHYFLGRHSPLRHLATEVADDPAVPRSLRFLLRQLQAELRKLDGAGVLQRVDATTPTMDPTDVSYRYPFQSAEGADVAPIDWTDADWDGYQGNAAGVIGAIDRFLRVVDNRRLAARA
jgi:hypothetical protein